MNQLRILHSRHDTGAKELFKKAGAVVKSGADVGGDVRVAWDPDNEDEVKAVGKLFDELKGRGFTAIQIGDDGKQKDGQKIEKFDKAAGRMVMVPQLQGGA